MLKKKCCVWRGKNYPLAKLDAKWHEFEQDFKVLKTVDDKVKVPRDKEAHPIDKVFEISLQAFTEDLQRLKLNSN